MKYNFVLNLDVVDCIVSISDRNGVITNIKDDWHFVDLELLIEMPNTISLKIVKKNNGGFVQLHSLSLGHIPFSKESLEQTFIYEHDYGLSRETLWNLDGIVKFELFDLDPIRYHLHLETKI